MRERFTPQVRGINSTFGTIMQTQIYKDTTGLRVLWDAVKKCYCFEDHDGTLLPFTITMQSGDPVEDGYSGPTIEALLAVAKHRVQYYNQGEWKCEENDRTIFGIDLGLWNLEQRFRRIFSKKPYAPDTACKATW